MKHEPDQAAPNDWITLVNDRCDLDLAYKALEGWDHFHTDTIRGRIRSLQLRPGDAWEFFERAGERTNEYGRSPRNLLRRFYLKVYCFENALMEDSEPRAGQASRIDKCLKSLLSSEVPDSEIASQQRTNCHGLYLLHQEDYSAARKLFKRLLRDSADRVGDEKAGFYFGASIAHRGMGEDADADRQLENALLFVPALDNTFNMGIYSGVAGALLRLWEREEEAREWDEFLVRLKIPKKTAELFRERSKRILTRSASLKRVFLF